MRAVESAYLLNMEGRFEASIGAIFLPGQSTTSHSKPASQPKQGQSKPAQSKPVRKTAPQSKPASAQPKQGAAQPKAPAAPGTPSQPRRNKVVVNQPQTGNQYGDKKKNRQQRTKESTKRQAMLNTHRINPFKYDMNQILEASTMDPAKASSFLASVIAKASRVSTREAKDFVKTFLDAGDLTKDEADKIGKLLDKYSRYR